MKKALAVLMAFLLIAPNVVVANPMTARLTNRVMGMLEPRIAEMANNAPVPPDVKAELTRQLTDAARRLVDSEIQSAAGGRPPNPNALVNKVVGELATVSQNIVQQILGGSLALDGGGGTTGTAQVAPRAKPSLSIEPFVLWGYTDSDTETIIRMLSMQDDFRSAFNVVADNAEYVLLTEVRRLGDATVLMMQILDRSNNSLIADGNLSFQAIGEVAGQLPQLASRLAAPVLASMPAPAPTQFVAQPQQQQLGYQPPCNLTMNDINNLVPLQLRLGAHNDGGGLYYRGVQMQNSFLLGPLMGGFRDPIVRDAMMRYDDTRQSYTSFKRRDSFLRGSWITAAVLFVGGITMVAAGENNENDALIGTGAGMAIGGVLALYIPLFTLPSMMKNADRAMVRYNAHAAEAATSAR